MLFSLFCLAFFEPFFFYLLSNRFSVITRNSPIMCVVFSMLCLDSIFMNCKNCFLIHYMMIFFFRFYFFLYLITIQIIIRIKCIYVFFVCVCNFNFVIMTLIHSDFAGIEGINVNYQKYVQNGHIYNIIPILMRSTLILRHREIIFTSTSTAL